MDNQIYMSIVTVPDEATANKIADTIVLEGLAACVNVIGPIRSAYIWDDVLQHNSELQLIIKSPVATYDNLKKRIIELHPYELPEILAFGPRDGLDDYIKWVSNSNK